MSASIDPAPPPILEDPAQAMTAYGIERVPVDVFHWQGYRYSSLKDAIAAAKRAQRDSGSAAHA